MTTEFLCERLIRTPTKVLVRCDGVLVIWAGTDGHNGKEMFSTCQKCGHTS